MRIPAAARASQLLLVLMVLALGACASGSAIVTGKTRAPVAPEQVKLYLEPPPAAFEVIGLVKASSDSGLTAQGSVDYAIAELKRQAAKLGANGVLIVASGEKTATMISGHGSYTNSYFVTGQMIEAKAIYVSEP